MKAFCRCGRELAAFLAAQNGLLLKKSLSETCKYGTLQPHLESSRSTILELREAFPLSKRDFKTPHKVHNFTR